MKENNYSCLFDEKYREDYQKNNTGAKNPNHSFDTEEETTTNPQTPPQQETKVAETGTESQAIPELYGHPITDYITALLPNGAARNSRHKEALRLADDLLIMLDGNVAQAHQVLLAQPWVQDVIKERGAKEIDSIMEAAKKHFQKREAENLYAPWPSKRMTRAIERVTKKSFRQLISDQGVQKGDGGYILNYAMKIGNELKRLLPDYPLLRLMSHGLRQKYYVSSMFAGGAFGMTLMTRCWYRFYGDPGRKCRMNCIFELIGPSGNGKRFLVNMYKIMMKPVKEVDEKQVRALNRWNEEQNTKGANKDKSSRPQGVFRCLPPESSAAAIREAELNAKEIIDGEEWPLHVFLFDSELDNTITQMKKGYMDISTLYLKGFHNEPHGSFLKSTLARVGEYDVHLNCVYSGTKYALDKQVNDKNYNTGLAFRLTLVPMVDNNFEMMENREYNEEDKKRDALLLDWSRRMDRCKGEIPVKMLSDKLYEWTKNRMMDAKEDNSLIDNQLLKRCAWHAINYVIPYIVTRHWSEMVEENGYMVAGPDFKLDQKDWQLCQLMANAQYTFQRYFITPIAESFFNKSAMEEASNHSMQTRGREAYMSLPEIFGMEDVMKCYGYSAIGSACSRLKRLQDDGLSEKIRSGENKGKYRRLF